METHRGSFCTMHLCVLTSSKNVERPKERPIATVDEVFALADAINPRYRGLLLLASLTLP